MLWQKPQLNCLTFLTYLVVPETKLCCSHPHIILICILYSLNRLFKRIIVEQEVLRFSLYVIVAVAYLGFPFDKWYSIVKTHVWGKLAFEILMRTFSLECTENGLTNEHAILFLSMYCAIIGNVTYRNTWLYYHLLEHHGMGP